MTSVEILAALEQLEVNEAAIIAEQPGLQQKLEASERELGAALVAPDGVAKAGALEKQITAIQTAITNATLRLRALVSQRKTLQTQLPEVEFAESWARMDSLELEGPAIYAAVEAAVATAIAAAEAQQLYRERVQSVAGVGGRLRQQFQQRWTNTPDQHVILEPLLSIQRWLVQAKPKEVAPQ